MILILTFLAVPVSLALGALIAAILWRIKHGEWPQR
jgi:nitrogen fixation-related uncharacterized protein